MPGPDDQALTGEQLTDKDKAQNDQEAIRQRQVQEYLRADRAFNRRYEENLLRQHRVISFEWLTGVEEPDPEDELKNMQGGILYAKDPVQKKMAEYGKYAVLLGTEKSRQEYQIEFSAKGVKPHPMTPAGWEAAIDFIAMKTRASTIVLQVPGDPKAPEVAIDNLLMWTSMCIKKGLGVELSPEADYFLRGITGDSNHSIRLLERKKLVMEAIDLANARLAESKVYAAAAEQKHSWLPADVRHLAGLERKAEAKITELNTKQTAAETDRNTKIDELTARLAGAPDAEKPALQAELDGLRAAKEKAEADAKVEKAETLFNELKTGLEELQTVHNRLAGVQQAEIEVMQRPDRLVKADAILTIPSWPNTEEAYGKLVRQKLRGEGDTRPLPVRMNDKVAGYSEAEKIAMRFAEINKKVNSDPAVVNKTELLETLEKQRDRLSKLEREVDAAVKALPNANKKKEDMTKKLTDGKFEDILKNNGSMQQEQSAMKKWNQSGRKSAFDDIKQQMEGRGPGLKS